VGEDVGVYIGVDLKARGSSNSVADISPTPKRRKNKTNKDRTKNNSLVNALSDIN
jgi:hypothetical protein